MKAYPEEIKERARALYIPGVRGEKAVAGIMGLPASTVRRWVDPEFAEQMRVSARRRKQGYRGRCVDCGRSTSYSGIGSQPSKRCSECRNALEHANRRWTHETIVEAVQRWTLEHGQPPGARDWVRSDPVNHYPAATAVYGQGRVFAAWNDVIRAAGFAPRPSGYYTPEEAAGKPDERRRSQLGKIIVPNEVYIEQIRAASRDGIAPAAEDVHNAWWKLRKRGIDWGQACALAGVRPRGRGNWGYLREKADRRSLA